MGKLLNIFVVITFICLLSLSQVAHGYLYYDYGSYKKVATQSKQHGGNEEQGNEEKKNIKFKTRKLFSQCTYEMIEKEREWCIATFCHMVTYEVPVFTCHD